jgi:hypothetical protein
VYRALVAAPHPFPAATPAVPNPNRQLAADLFARQSAALHVNVRAKVAGILAEAGVAV